MVVQIVGNAHGLAIFSVARPNRARMPGRVGRVSAAGDQRRAEHQFFIEDMSVGVFASGYGYVGDGRAFSFRVDKRQLVVEIYRPVRSGPVPQPEDVIATATCDLVEIDLDDERSLIAAVRDVVADRSLFRL